MRNISFSKTTQQIRDRTKTVTRRLGWWNIKNGEKLCAVEKAQGLKKGEKINRICVIEVISSKREMIYDLLDDPEYARIEMIKEGFPGMKANDFIDMFMNINEFDYTEDPWNRIEFKYTDIPC